MRYFQKPIQVLALDLLCPKVLLAPLPRDSSLSGEDRDNSRRRPRGSTSSCSRKQHELLILERLLHHIGSCRAAADDANMLSCRRIVFFCPSWRTANNPCLETQKKATVCTHVSTVTQHLKKVQTLNVHRTPPRRCARSQLFRRAVPACSAASQFREPLVG